MNVSATRPCLRNASIVVVLASLVAAGGCTPVTLMQLDKEWMLTYQAKVRADETGTSALADFDGQLADLSRRAEQAADQAGGDAPTAIGLYRIAAVSAWKAGPLREEDVPRISAKGRRSCDTLPDRHASQPRDCLLLIVVDDLALYDREARNIAAIASRPPPLSAAEQQQTLQSIDVVASVLSHVIEVRRDAARLPVAASFANYLATNVTTQYCAMHGLAGAVFASNPAAELSARLAQSIRIAEELLIGAQVSTSCATAPP